MSEPKELRVNTIISSTYDSDIHVVDKMGMYPHEVVASQENPVEIAQEIGRRVVAEQLEVYTHTIGDYKQPHTGIVISVANVRTAPVDPDSVQLTDGYTWSKV